MSQSRTTSRVEWVDAAKGIAILLVVVHHSVLILGQLGLLAGPWAQINNAFQVFRMPVFFAAAGLFAASALDRSWQVLWERRLSLYVWVFAVWTIARFLYFLAFPIAERPGETDLIALALAPLLPSTGLWFLHALFFFFVVAKLMRGRVDYRVQLCGAGVLSVAFLSFHAGNISWTGMGKYFFFFLAGCYLRDVVEGWARASTWGMTVAAGVAFGGGVVLISVLNLHLFGPAALVVRVVAVVFGILLSAMLVRFWVGRMLVLLGKRTLEIYVAHVLVIAFVGSTLAQMGGLPSMVANVLPLIVVPVAVLACLGLHWVCMRVPGLDLLYRAPSFVSLKAHRVPA